MNFLGLVGIRIGFAVGMVVSVGCFGRVVGVASPWFALIASFSILGLFDLALPFARTRVPRGWRDVRSWEVRGSVYRAIGVPVFGEILRRTPLRLLNRRVYLTAGRGALTAVRRHMEDAEAAHFWGGIATIPYLAFATYRSWWMAVGSVVVFNLFVNTYPILHLRSVRGRIDETMGRHLSRQPNR